MSLGRRSADGPDTQRPRLQAVAMEAGDGCGVQWQVMSRSFQASSMLSAYSCGLVHVTYPGVGYETWCLDLDDLLQEFDAYYLDGNRAIVHALEDVEFDCQHGLPDWRLVGVGASRMNMSETSSRHRSIGRLE
jgi:hypothetical protein